MKGVNVNDYSLIIQQGRLTRDPVVSYSTNGTCICKFSIATNDGYKDKEHVSFHEVTAFGVVGVNCEKYLKKGNPVIVQGRSKQDRWTDQNGQNRSKHYIEANLVQFLYTGNKEGKNECDNNGYSETLTSTIPNDPWKDADIPL